MQGAQRAQVPCSGGPGQGTRFPHVTTKTQHHQINKYFKNDLSERCPQNPGQPGLAAHRPCSRLALALTSSQGASPPSEWPPLPGDTSTKQCWPFCKPGIAPSPEGHCKEPSPLIRTGRLGLRPAQAQADFSGHKTCKLFPVGSLEMQPAGAWEASHFPWPPAGQVQLWPPASWMTEASE